MSAFGARIAVLTDDRALLPLIQQQLPFGAVAASFGAPDRVLRLSAGPQGALYVGRRLIRRSTRRDVLLGVLRRQLQFAVARFARDYVFIHAGVVAWEGRALVIPGRSFSGKSMLVKALLDAGASYMSDEFAPIDPRGWVQAYPRPLSLRGPVGGRTMLPVDADAERCLPIGAVLLTRFAPGRRWEPRAAGAGEGMLELLANAVPARDQPRRAVQAIKRAVLGATILAGERGEASEMATSLLMRLRGEGESR